MNVGISREMARSGAVLVRVSYAGTALADADFSGPRGVRIEAGQARGRFGWVSSTIGVGKRMRRSFSR